MYLKLILLFSILTVGWLLAHLEKEQELHQEINAPQGFMNCCTQKTGEQVTATSVIFVQLLKGS